MALWRKAKSPVRKVIDRVATRVGSRKSGLPKLRHDVKTCEYEDVRVMWNMLNEKERPEATRLGGGSRKKQKTRQHSGNLLACISCRHF